jgi:hypothetical protein
MLLACGSSTATSLIRYKTIISFSALRNADFTSPSASKPLISRFSRFGSGHARVGLEDNATDSAAAAAW